MKDTKHEKERVLATAIAAVEKKFGKGSVMLLGQKKIVKVPVISSGSIGLDIALGIGGYPRGRIVEVFGPEGGGKTTMGLEAIAQAQKKGGTCAFIDTEHALDIFYAGKIGVDVDKLLFSQPDTGEQALETAEILIRSGTVDLLVLDSVAGLVPKVEIEGEMGEMKVGLVARLMSQAMRKLAGVVNRSNTCAIFINQIRMKIGVMYQNPEVTPGGLALKFHASVRCDIRRRTSIKKDEEIIGSRTRVKVVKNKLAPPFRECFFDIIYGKGILRMGELADIAVQRNLIEKAGAWYEIGGERVQGRDALVEYLTANDKVASKILHKIFHEEPEA